MRDTPFGACIQEKIQIGEHRELMSKKSGGAEIVLPFVTRDGSRTSWVFDAPSTVRTQGMSQESRCREWTKLKAKALV